MDETGDKFRICSSNGKQRQPTLSLFNFVVFLILKKTSLPSVDLILMFKVLGSAAAFDWRPNVVSFRLSLGKRSTSERDQEGQMMTLRDVRIERL